MCASAPVQPSRASRRRSCSTKRHLERSTDGRERANLRKRADGSHQARVAVNGAAAQTLCARLTTGCATSAASLSSCAMRRMRRSSWFSRRLDHALPNLRHHASTSGVLLPRALATHAARRRLSRKALAGARGARRARALASWNGRDPSRWRRMRHRAASAPARLEAWSEPGGRRKKSKSRGHRERPGVNRGHGVDGQKCVSAHVRQLLSAVAGPNRAIFARFCVSLRDARSTCAHKFGCIF